jgi:hypothetical protein
MAPAHNHDAMRTGPRGFREFRRSRPFWAGVFTLASGLIVLFPPYASLKLGDMVISMNTMGGISSLVIGIVLVSCAISFWVRPQFRIPAGIVTLVLALVAIVTANLGSFLIGTLLGMIGAALGLAWSPDSARRRRLGRRNTQPSTEEDTGRQEDPAGDQSGEDRTKRAVPGMAAPRARTSRRRHVNRPHGAGA